VSVRGREGRFRGSTSVGADTCNGRIETGCVSLSRHASSPSPNAAGAAQCASAASARSRPTAANNRAAVAYSGASAGATAAGNRSSEIAAPNQVHGDAGRLPRHSRFVGGWYRSLPPPVSVIAQKGAASAGK
jgi:hypothetical protein